MPQHHQTPRRALARTALATLIAAGLAGPATALDYVWLGANGSFESAANWSLVGVPGSGDTARISSGRATLSSNRDLQRFYLTGGGLIGTGNLSVSDVVGIEGGQIGGYGGQLISNGSLVIAGNNGKNLGANGGAVSSGIVNNGSGTWSGLGNLDNWASGRFTNGAAASFDIQTDADFLNGVFINQGTLIKSVGSAGASTRVTASFDNSGSVSVQQGVLSFTNGGTHTGSFTTGATSWIEFAGGSTGRIHSLDAGASVSGNVRFTDAFTATVVNAGATYNATRTEMTNGSLLQVAAGVTANTGTAGISGGTFRGPGQLVASGGVSFSGGQIGGDGGQLVANGGLAISGSASKYLGANAGSISSGIVNNGAATWTGTGNLDNWATGRFTNTVAGSLDIQSDADFLNGVFINQGALIKSVGSAGASTRVTASFDNSGSVSVQQGVLSFTNGGTHTGSFTTSGDGWIEFAGGSSGRLHSLDAGASVSGNVRFTDAFTATVVNAGATYNAARTEMTNGSLLQVAAGVTANTGTAGISGGTFRGPGQLVASGGVSFSGGQIGGDGGQLVANGGLAISGSASKYLGANAGSISSGIVNNGAATWTGTGNLDNWATGRFTNTAAGSLDIQSDADFLNGVFINQGALTKSVGSAGASTRVTASFDNSGSVSVQQGVLSFTNGGTHTGSFTTSGDGWIEFAGGSSGRLHSLATGASVSGNVRFTDAFTATVVNAGVSYNTTRTELVSGGLLQVAAGVTANTATAGISGGALRGAGELVASGPVSYTGGQIGGDGGQLVARGGLAISGNSSKTLGMNGGAVAGGIANHGAATWSGNSFDNWANGRFVNTATGRLDIQTDADFLGGAFINQGTLMKSVGASSGTGTVFTSSLSNTGAIEVQQGSLEVRTAFNNQGSLAVAAGAVFYGNHASFTNSGSVQGAGTVRTATNGALLNQGLIAPGFSVGTLTLDGDLTMATGGSLQVELTSLASFDQLVITDDAFFAGTLSVVGLGYTPVVGDSFRIITLDQRLAGSQFAALTVSGFSSAVSFDVTYNLHDVTLTVASVTAVPEPATWLMGLAGLAAVGAIVRRRRLQT